LFAGLWLGFLFVPARVRTLRNMWQFAGDGAPGMLLPAIGVVALIGVLAVGLAVGTAKWQGQPVAGMSDVVLAADSRSL
jgi:hypothetical protein